MVKYVECKLYVESWTGYIFSQIIDSTYDGIFWCNFMNMEYVSEQRKGYYSKCAIYKKQFVQLKIMRKIIGP